MSGAPITTLEDFAKLMAESVCSNPNTRLNNMIMLKAINAKPMPEILNKAKMAEATIAYRKVLDVIIRAELGNERDDTEDNLVLTYDRFMVALSEVKKYLLIINS